MKKILILSFSLFFSISIFAQEEVGRKLSQDPDFKKLLEIAFFVSKESLKGQAKGIFNQRKDVKELKYKLLERYEVLNHDLGVPFIEGLIPGIEFPDYPSNASTPEQELVDCLERAEIASIAMGVISPPAGLTLYEIMTDKCLKKYDEATETIRK